MFSLSRWVSGQWSVFSETGAVLQFTKDMNSDKTSVLALCLVSVEQCSALQCSTVQYNRTWKKLTPRTLRS